MKKGCLGCLSVVAFLAIAFVIVLAYSDPTSTTTENAKPSPLRRLSEKSYEDQTMVLYVLDGEWSEPEFKRICQLEKAKNTGSFRVVAVFDTEANAVFPNNPPSAFYGIETEPLKHILASYTHNAINDFEETTPYNPQK